MSQVGPTQFDPIAIGDVAKPPFARLPNPATLFDRRAARLRALADGHQLRSYLLFLANVCAAQHRLQPGLPAAEIPPADAIDRARQFKMPPFDRMRFRRDESLDAIWARLLALADEIPMPDEAQAALRRVKAAEAASAAAMIGAVLANA